MDQHNKEKEDLEAKCSSSLQEMGDCSLPPAQIFTSQEDEDFMEEVEQIPSLSEENLMVPQTLVKEARYKAGILKAVERFSGSTSCLQHRVQLLHLQGQAGWCPFCKVWCLFTKDNFGFVHCKHFLMLNISQINCYHFPYVERNLNIKFPSAMEGTTIGTLMDPHYYNEVFVLLDLLSYNIFTFGNYW